MFVGTCRWGESSHFSGVFGCAAGMFHLSCDFSVNPEPVARRLQMRRLLATLAATDIVHRWVEVGFQAAGTQPVVNPAELEVVRTPLPF